MAGAMDSSAIPQLWDAIISVNDLSSQPGAQPELVSASDALVVAAKALVPAGKNSFIEHVTRQHHVQAKTWTRTNAWKSFVHICLLYFRNRGT